MKKLLSVLILGLLVITLSACELLNSPEVQDILSDITFSGVEDIEVTVGEELDLLEGVSVLGNDDLDYLNDVTLDSTCTITDGILDTSTAGTCTVTYEVVVSDVTSFATITVTITDATDNDPVITGAADVVVEDGSSFDLLAGVAASDVEDGDLTSSVTTTVTGPNDETTFDGTVEGAWTVVYSVTDMDDNTVTATRVITIGEAVEYVWAAYGYEMAMTDGAYTFTYSGITAQFWTMNAQYELTTPLDASTGAVEFTFTGEVGQDYIFKAEGPENAFFSEVSVTATGDEQVVSVPLDSLTAEQIQGLAKLVLFATTVDGAGSVTVSDVSFVMPEPAWAAYGWTLTQDGMAYNFEYADTAEAWWNNNAQHPLMDALDPATESIDFTFTGVLDQTYLFKVEGGGAAYEEAVTATGAEQVFSLTLGGFTPEELAGLDLIVLFATTVGGSGTVTVSNVEFVVSEPSDWAAYGWTMTETETGVVFDYTGTTAEWWNNNAQYTLPMALTGNEASVDFTFTGEANQEYLFKIEGGGAATELGTTATGEEQVFSLPLGALTSEQILGLNLIVLFAQTLDGSGSVSVTNIDFVIDETSDWAAYGWTMTETETSVSFDYAGTTAEWWNNNAQYTLPMALSGNETAVEFTFTGVADQEYLFKIEGNGAAFELGTTATGSEQVFTLPLDSFTAEQIQGLNLVVLFAQTLDGSGTITVTNVEFVLPNWLGYGMTVVEGETAVTIDYADTAAEWWNNNAQFTFPMALSGNETAVEFTFTGVAGHDYLFKIEGNGSAFELAATGTGSEQVLSVPLDSLTAEQIQGLNLIVVFSQTLGASGTLSISNVEFVVPAWLGYGLTVMDDGSTVTIDYANTPEAWWSNNAQWSIDPLDATATGITFTFTGVDGHSYLFKIEGAGAYEEAVVGTGAEQTFTLTLDGFNDADVPNLSLVVVFVQTLDASGTLTITDITVDVPA